MAHTLDPGDENDRDALAYAAERRATAAAIAAALAKLAQRYRARADIFDRFRNLAGNFDQSVDDPIECEPLEEACDEAHDFVRDLKRIIAWRDELVDEDQVIDGRRFFNELAKP